MYRIPGVINAFKKAAAVEADREIGEFIFLNAAGEGTYSQSDVAFPLTEQFKHELHQNFAAQVTGVANVKVKTAAGITAGVPVQVADDGKGVVAQTVGTQVGVALKTPGGDGDNIPVLLGIQLADGGY